MASGDIWLNNPGASSGDTICTNRKMIQGIELADLANKVIQQAQSKKDYAMDTRNLRMTDDALLAFTLPDREVTLKPTTLCLEQIGDRVGIPARYLERMRTEAPTLLASNVNHWFKNKPEVRMLRTLQNGVQEARAFLSNSYRAFDNYDLVSSVVPRLQAVGCRVQSAQLTETRLYIQAILPGLYRDIKQANVGDTLYAGVTISNSEVGKGSVRVEPLIFKSGCKNGMILTTALKRHHIGRAGEGGMESGDAYEVFTDETRKLDDKAFWSKVNDVVASAIDTAKFHQNVDKLQLTTGIQIENPLAAIEIVAKRCNLLEMEKAAVLQHLLKGGDTSVWGMANAVTRTAEDSTSYDRAVELQREGYKIIELASEFAKN